MAGHDQIQTAFNTSRRVPGPTAMRVGSLAAGGLGLLGFALAIFAGLAAGNPAGQILYRAIIALIAMAAIGGLAGAMAGRVIHEQLLNQARLIQEQQAQARQAARASAEQLPPEPGQQGSDGQSGTTGKNS